MWPTRLAILPSEHSVTGNRAVALKMLLAGPCTRPEELKRFLREAEAVARLRHPNIVQVDDVGEVAGRPYFTMELIEGGNLAEKIQATPQPARQAAALIATLADAIHVAHQNGIVPRDLKPGNIMLTGDGTPKVTDFGLALRRQGSADAYRRADGDAEFHVPVPGARRQDHHRPGNGHLRSRGNSVRATHRPATVPRRQPDGDTAAGGFRRSDSTGEAEPAHPARSPNYLPEVPVQGASESLYQRASSVGRLAPS